MRPTTRDLLHDVATAFGLEHLGEDDFIGRDRHKTIAEARCVAMWCTRKLFRMSFPEVGREFERDHSTVMSAVRKIDRLIRVDPSCFLASTAIELAATFRPTALRGVVSTNGARELNLGMGGSHVAIGAAE